MTTRRSKWIKLIALVAVLVLAYLFALNGRYEPLGGNERLLLDKWTRKCYYLDADKIEFRTIEQDIKRKQMRSDEDWEQYRVE